MNLIQLENLFSNLTFVSFACSSLFFWSNIIFSFSLRFYRFIENWVGKINFIFTIILLMCHWINCQHFPLSNLYESLLFLICCLSFFQLFINNFFHTKITTVLTTSFCLFLNSFSTFFLPIEMKQISPLVPALKSNWLLMHVSIILVSYAALMLGSLFSLIYLLVDQKIDYQISKKISNLSYKFIGFGFPLLTLGIISGSVWANQAWGSYWSWDPKETWALITWLIFAIYLHTRLVAKWSSYRSALIASLGFPVLWVCYLGVNLLGKGLHSYGWWI